MLTRTGVGLSDLGASSGIEGTPWSAVSANATRVESRSLNSESMKAPMFRSRRSTLSCISLESCPYPWPIASVADSEIDSTSVCGAFPRERAFSPSSARSSSISSRKGEA